MRYDENSVKIQMSVDELISLAMPHGDLGTKRDSRTKNPVGTKIHKIIEKATDGEYTPDLSLRHTSLHDGLYYEVTGTAPGIIDNDGGITVDDVYAVKTAYYIDISPINYAKVKCFAHFICDTQGIESINVRLAYYCSDTKETKFFTKEYSRAALAAFYNNLLEKAKRFALLEKEKAEKRIPSIQALCFPYSSIRDGQKELISAVFRAIKKKRRLLAQAPTGTGKTISALYPAVKAYGEGLCDKIFYLTAKNSTGQSARDALSDMCAAGAELKYVSLSSRESVCFIHCGNAGCDPTKCEYANGYHARALDAIYELLSTKSSYDKKLLLETAKKYRVCPHELSLDLSLWCDIIICDYNYVFDPRVYLRRYFDFINGRYVFLADEAHNLSDRAREMYSCELSLSPFVELYRMLPEKDKILRTATLDAAKLLWAQKKPMREDIRTDEQGNELGFRMSREMIPGATEKLKKFTDCCERWFYFYRDLDERFAPLQSKISDLYFSAREFLGILDCYDERFVTYTELYGKEIKCRLFCLDPSHVLDICMNRAISTTLFSATLTPPEYYSDILGLGKRADTLSLPSPFERDNLCLAAIDTISTRYADRESNTNEVSELIAAAVSAKKGNYIVYFPSYRYMNSVYSHFTASYPSVKTAVQKSGKDKIGTAAFLSQFKAQSDHHFVGFCVLGGSFSEGIDLPGERLIGAVAVGVGIPQISNELNIIREHYEATYEKGYEYAYVYPGMNKILQATGRVIRREGDRGIVVLIDDRYASPDYIRLFPEHWSELKYVGNARSLAAYVKKFWNKFDSKDENE